MHLYYIASFIIDIVFINVIQDFYIFVQMSFYCENIFLVICMNLTSKNCLLMDLNFCHLFEAEN